MWLRYCHWHQHKANYPWFIPVLIATYIFLYSGLATEIKPDVGLGKTYQVPEYFGFNKYSYFDVEKTMEPQRVIQPDSGLSEYWGDSSKGKI